MVVVALDRQDLASLLGREVSTEKLEEVLPRMGMEIKGWEDDVLRVEVLYSRPDMQSVEGVARALKGHLGLAEGMPAYDLKVSGIDFLADPNVAEVRPYVVGGLVTDLPLTEALVVSLVDLQEKLHVGLGRRRRKVAIGLHDADTVEPPFRYKAFPPDGARFVPLGGAEEMSLGEILRDHEKGREYAPILEGKPLLPLILDAREQVLSFPPIINGTVTALTPETENLFIDVTGTDFAAVSSALNILMTALAERGGQLASVTIMHPEEAFDTPDLAPRSWEVSLKRTNAWLGLSLSRKKAVDALRRMRLDTKGRGDRIEVSVPAYRTDILHEVDLMEDVAIGYGYHRIAPTLPGHGTLGGASPLNEFTKALRQVLVGHGLQEIRTLTSEDAESPFRAPDGAVEIRNPLSSDLTVVRASLLPSVLRILQLNRRRELPQRFFEVDDVVLGGYNRRHVAGVLIHPKAGFTEVKGLVEGVLRDVGLTLKVEGEEDPNFLAGRCAQALVGEERLGILGEVHPEVIVAYELRNPVVGFELDVEALFALAREPGPAKD